MSHVSLQGIHAEEFSDKTPYSIMFGPDKCGGTNKVHLIFRYKNPKTGEVEEKHMKGKNMRIGLEESM